MKTIISKIAFSALLLLLSTGFGFRCNQQTVQSLTPVTLQYWRVFDNEDTMTDIIGKYKTLHPNIDIVYRKFRYDEYEQQLLSAFAEDRAPDIFSIPNSWVARYSRQLMPAPAETVLPVLKTTGTIKKEQVVEYQRTSGFRPRDVQTMFVDTVAGDVILGDKVLALPLALDTMALYYNKSLLAQGGVASPPKTWQEVQDIASKLTKIGDTGAIIQSAIALGGSDNVPRAFDILSVLMMQNGALMAANDGSPLFDKLPPNSQSFVIPGVQALQFYSDFANPTKTTYTWNNNMPNAFELFTQGRLAMMLGYSYTADQLKISAPHIDWDVASLPQVDPNFRVEYANYWVEGVSSKTAHPNEAWGFVQFATNADIVGSYLTATSKPTALRDLAKRANDLAHPLSIFTDAVLTAQTWYHGEDPASAEQAFATLVDAVTTPRDDLDYLKFTKQAAGQISSTLVRQRP
ncbi:extracellular solute-binding protein [Candidatus Uhrbacteria bacterium]|nr:extracellular solute-binding protein [Candidatus Uhrbacteria bacterium]